MVTLCVSLKIPDTTAITAHHTMKAMGFKVEKVEREDYYEFGIEGDEESFRKKIVKADIVINANKHKHHFGVEGDGVKILVMDNEQGTGLLSTLKNRLGFKEIISVKKGTLWKLSCSEEDAKKIAQKLLHNEQYQSYKIVGG